MVAGEYSSGRIEKVDQEDLRWDKRDVKSSHILTFSQNIAGVLRKGGL